MAYQHMHLKSLITSNNLNIVSCCFTALMNIHSKIEINDKHIRDCRVN
jgi:hypothetical protein